MFNNECILFLNTYPLTENGMAFLESVSFFNFKNLLDYLLHWEMSETAPKIHSSP